jgi:hypothetical protein
MEFDVNVLFFFVDVVFRVAVYFSVLLCLYNQ